MGIIAFFRNTISGAYYVIYVIVLSIFLFAMVGYLFKQKYAKVEFKLSTVQPPISKQAETTAVAQAPTQTKGKEKTKKKVKAKSTASTPTNNKVLPASQMAPTVSNKKK